MPPRWFRRDRKPLVGACAWGLMVVLLGTGPAWGTPARRPAPRRASPAARSSAADGAAITATAALLMDAKTGQVLYDRNGHLEWPPASTTKIMTALVALERVPLDTPITISAAAARFREGSVVGLPERARIPLRDLLYALMLPSGNDVAVAIAEGVAGTVAAFVAEMNARARELGATQTHFTSPHGLYQPDHYTTAYDLGLIARAAMENPQFREIVQTKAWMLSVHGRRAQWLLNHNRLLSRYPGADGIKTGYVHQSGLTLVASATHDGWRLLAVVLHSRDMYGDASRLLTYGYGHYHPALLASAGESLLTETIAGADVPLVGTVPEPVYGVVTDGTPVQHRVALDDRLRLPVLRGSRIGEVVFSAAGRVVCSVPLVAAGDVRRHAVLPGAPKLAGTVGWLLGHLVMVSPLPLVF